MNVRPLAGSRSSHAPRPAHQRCPSDLGVFIAAFPQRVETREEEMNELEDLSFIMIDEMLNDTASYACPECGIVTQCYTNCPLQAKGN